VKVEIAEHCDVEMGPKHNFNIFFLKQLHCKDGSSRYCSDMMGDLVHCPSTSAFFGYFQLFSAFSPYF
jgi:hypothetical protein